MRKILFRGRRVDNRDWVYGVPFNTEDSTVIITDISLYEMYGIDSRRCAKCYAVDPATVGQYTGLTDKNGKKIFEGDILRFPAKDQWEQKNFVGYEVFFHDNDCADRHVGWQMNRQHFYGALCGGEYMYSFLPKWTSRMEIIGNIIDNPELLQN